MSKQAKNNQTGLIIGAGAAVILLMAGALLYLRWTLHADPSAVPPTAVTVVVMVLPVLVMFTLFAVVMKRLWPAKPVGGNSDKEPGGDA